MLSVHQGDRLPPLADHLFDVMESTPLGPLEAEVLVVAQNTGLRGWLENALARRAGCAASLAMPAPRALCLDLAHRLVEGAAPAAGEAAPRDPFDPGPLTWRIAAFLDALPDEERFAPLRAYLRSGGSEGRRLPLARRIAQRLSDYQVYRPHLLGAWADGETPFPDHPHAAWQAPLWRHLTTRAERPDRARRLLTLQEKLREGDVRVASLPERVAVVGAGLFPSLYVDVLAALARHIPVRFYLVDGGESAGDEGELRARLGRQRRVWRGLLREHADEWYRLDASARPEAPSTVLEALQSEASPPSGGQDDPRARFEIPTGDRSLGVHSCHSPRRELEVLRDQLLDAFETQPDLTPANVLVLTPNLEAYAPLIETTFEAEAIEAEAVGETPGEHHSGDGLRLPVHIASAHWSEERRVLEALLALLALPESRCTAAEVIELLDYPVLRRAAGLTPREVPVARRWTREAGVHWGRDAVHRDAFDLPARRAGTWEAGRDRLLLGYVMGPTDALAEGRLPCAEAGADRAGLLGRWSAWLRRLFSFADEAQTDRSLAAWSTLMADAVTDLIAPDSPAEHDAVEHLIEAVQGLEYLNTLAPGAEDRADGDPTAPVPFAAVREHVEEAVRSYEASTEHVTGSVTFADPMALRFAPYRVVAFMGLGDDFPPTPARPDYDLLAAAPRATDSDPEREGTQLFYDALCAAEDRFILTYVGRSQKDNAERAPSAVLEALLAACERCCTVEGGGDDDTEHPVRERLVTEHPLQPFSPAYFAPGGPLFSYDRAHCVERADDGSREAEAEPFVAGPLPPPEEGDDEDAAATRLDDVQRAWSHPARHFCTRVLGLRLEGEAPLDAQEPLDPDGPAAYRVRQETLRLALSDVPPETWEARLKASGHLPPGRLGTAWYARQRRQAQQVARVVDARGECRRRTLRAAGDEWAVAGRLDHVTDRGALAFRCAEPKAKDLARAWPAHLLLCAADDAGDDAGDDPPRTTLVVGTGETAWRLTPLAPADARRRLRLLVHGLRRICRKPPPFWPETSMTFVETDGDTYKTERALHGGYWRDGEASDPYVQLCLRGRDPLDDEHDAFEKWTRAFWEPLLACREEVRVA
jgi:exodeoxyribonuclease V gamma subunit